MMEIFDHIANLYLEGEAITHVEYSDERLLIIIAANVKKQLMAINNELKAAKEKQ